MTQADLIRLYFAKGDVYNSMELLLQLSTDDRDDGHE